MAKCCVTLGALANGVSAGKAAPPWYHRRVRINAETDTSWKIRKARGNKSAIGREPKSPFNNVAIKLTKFSGSVGSEAETQG